MDKKRKSKGARTPNGLMLEPLKRLPPGSVLFVDIDAKHITAHCSMNKLVVTTERVVVISGVVDGPITGQKITKVTLLQNNGQQSEQP